MEIREQDRPWKALPCIVWGGRLIGGYGVVSNAPRRLDGTRRWPERFAHRWAWTKFFGPIPPGKHVLHHCDNPPCIRPQHLFLGTHADNMRDMKLKGRRKLVACPTCGGPYEVRGNRRTCPPCLHARSRAYHKRRMADPAYREIRARYGRADYQKVKADPIRLERYRECKRLWFRQARSIEKAEGELR